VNGLSDEDRSLIERCLKGDEKAFEDLLSKYRNSVFSICLRMVRNSASAEDIAQEVFIKVFSALDRYDPSYPFSSWLNRITSNLCIDHLRREKDRTISLDQPVGGGDDDLIIQIPSTKAGPDREAESKEMMAMLENALGLLPEHYRIIVILRHQEQLSYEEISDTLGIPLGTVKARIHRARNMIMEYFQKRGLFLGGAHGGGE
jgi:RNA polymerase sigma-70 factor (ECF subfamily)